MTPTVMIATSDVEANAIVEEAVEEVVDWGSICRLDDCIQTVMGEGGKMGVESQWRKDKIYGLGPSGTFRPTVRFLPNSVILLPRLC